MSHEWRNVILRICITLLRNYVIGSRDSIEEEIRANEIVGKDALRYLSDEQAFLSTNQWSLLVWWRWTQLRICHEVSGTEFRSKGTWQSHMMIIATWDNQKLHNSFPVSYLEPSQHLLHQVVLHHKRLSQLVSGVWFLSIGRNFQELKIRLEKLFWSKLQNWVDGQMGWYLGEIGVLEFTFEKWFAHKRPRFPNRANDNYFSKIIKLTRIQFRIVCRLTIFYDKFQLWIK